jgi:subtilisin family serine protease
MSKQTRRTFLQFSGALLGGIAAGTTVTAATSPDRYLVDTAGVSDFAGVEVVHDLAAVNLAVVRGSEAQVERLGTTYANDLFYELQQPADGQLVREYGATKNNGKGNGKAKGQAESATDESLYPLQWDKQALDVLAAHEVTRGEGARVAVIDSGVAAAHPDLEHAVNLDLSQDFTGDGYGAGVPAGGYHGTHVAGIIAANDQNEEGVVGTAPAAEIIDCRVFTPDEEGASFGDILAAIVYSAEIGCDAANLSLGAYPIPREGLGGFYGKSLNRTMTYANAQGTVLVISAGNDSADLQHDGDFISLPNEGAQAISVSATGPIGFGWDAPDEAPPESPAFYTNYGTNAVTLGAPGGDADLDFTESELAWYYDLVLSTIAEPTFAGDGSYQGAEFSYGWAAGTSMAAPQVAGAVALYRSQYPDATTGDVEAALTSAASVPDGYDKAYYGAGVLDLVDAL